NAFNARVERGSALTRHLFTNPVLWGALAGVTVLQAVAVEWPPAQAIFRTSSLSTADWLLCTAVASSVLIYGELHRWTARHIRKRFPAKFNESSAGRC
ncbi:MAG: cation-translocating P-type ATPase C-terminal domain-containing protein, partial [SAR324 cluster bacterium]|nr:cation-translocating P-type ATPase C-terminal domain-containing protein [SAR324 cluster bacterium]